MIGSKNDRKARDKGRQPGFSLLQKILLLITLTIAIPTIWFEIYNAYMTRRLVEQKAVTEEANAIALAADSVDNTARNLVLQLLQFSEDSTLQNIARTMESPDITEADWRNLNLSFVKQMETGMRVERVYKIDMKIYAMLTYGDRGLFNYNFYSQDMEKCLDDLRSKKSGNPYVVCWRGLLKNYDMYRFDNENYLIVLGKQLEETQENSPFFWLGVMENSLRKQLFPDGVPGEQQRFLVDENMKILSAGDPAYIGKNFQEIVDIQILDENQVQKVRVDTAFGKAVVVGQKLENCPWMLVGIQPYSNLFQAIQKVNQRRIFFTWTAIAVFAVIVSLLSYRITSPLKKLSEEMMKFRPGEAIDLERVPVSGGKEIQRIYDCYYQMTQNICRLMEQNEDAQKEKRTIEMQLLQAQIKPHFLFNTLMSIRCAIENGNTEKASRMTLALSSFLRNTIAKGEEIISLQEEQEIIRTYVWIQNNRSYQKVVFKTEIESDLEKLEIPKLLLQPLIENSISHGFYEKEKGEILLTAKRQGTMAIITVEDDGGGFEVDPLECGGKGKHFGVYSIQNRLKLYYGDSGSLHYERTCRGTKAVVQLPISSKGGLEACGKF